MNETRQPTPRPWYFDSDWVCTLEHSFTGEWGRTGGERICTVDGSGSNDEANGRLIVRSVNAHDELIAALKELTEHELHATGCPLALVEPDGGLCDCGMDAALAAIARAEQP